MVQGRLLAVPTAYGKLTPGERAVWAAVFAHAHRELSRTPLLKVAREGEGWVDDPLVIAVEEATEAVAFLRALVDRAEHLDLKPSVAAMLLDVVGGE